MPAGKSWIGPTTRILIVASWLLAGATEVWLGAGLSPSLPFAAPFLFVAGLVAGRLAERFTFALLLGLLPLAPVLIMLVTGRFYVHHFAWWGAIFDGALLARLGLPQWNLPPRWRGPLVLWALSIALAWPLVALRECEWALDHLWDPRIHNAYSGIWPVIVIAWIASGAHALLLGVLWVDRLSRAPDARTIERGVVLPLLAGALASMPLAIYQGWIDLGFLSVGVWPQIGRAAGTLLDANAFGVAAALWGALATCRMFDDRGWRWAVYALSWGAVWATGSRTALLAAAIAGVFVARAALGPFDRRAARKLAAILLVLALAVLVLHRFAPTASPLSRIAAMFPEPSLRGAAIAGRALWERDTYGTVAVRMIREQPWAGVGFGTFNSLVLDYSRELGAPAPPDNAQNWFRHQLAETGLLGSLGWIIWVPVLVVALYRMRTATGLVVKGGLLAVAVASLLGMPTQNVAVALTVWTLIGWAAVESGGRPDGAPRRAAWIAAATVLAIFLGLTARAARTDLRVPNRAARFGFNYAYGIDEDPSGWMWTGAHAVLVRRAETGRLRLTVAVRHPDARTRPVDADVWIDGAHVINAKVRQPGPQVVEVNVARPNGYFVVEARVDRTFRPADFGQADARQLGLAMKWETW